MKKKLIFIFLSVFLMTGCTDVKKIESLESGIAELAMENKKLIDNANELAKKEIITFGSSLIFDEFEITIGSTIEWHTIPFMYDGYEHNGSEAFKIPLTIKNVSGEEKRFNMFFYKLLGSDGSELDSVTTFYNDTLDFMGPLQNEESREVYLYALYDGDGDYTIVFNDIFKTLKVELNGIKKVRP